MIGGDFGGTGTRKVKSGGIITERGIKKIESEIRVRIDIRC